MVRAWGLLTVEANDRQFSGNLGYEDILGNKYVWNNTVPNARAIQPGDLVVLRDKKYVLGIAWVDTIATAPGKKVQQRCPHCGLTTIKQRRSEKYGSMRFRCSESRCRAEFQEPLIDVLDVTLFEADYGRTWRPGHVH